MKDTVSDAARTIVRRNLLTFFNLVMLLLAAALIYARSYENLAFLGTVVGNILIGIIQELRAKKAMESLSMEVAPSAEVWRGGRYQTITVDQLTLSDRVRYRAGTRIAADGAVLDGEVEVDESNLTGESEPVWKQKGDALLSGGTVVSGVCIASVAQLGADSYISRVEAASRQYKEPESVLMRGLHRVTRIISWCVIPLGLALFIKSVFFMQTPVPDAVDQAAAAMLGMIPFGMILLASASMAVGVITLGKKHVLSRDLYCIEMLARVDVLCMDKTGTLTTGELGCEALLMIQDGALLPADALVTADIARLAANMHAENATAKALTAAFPAQGAADTPLEKLPFSSARKQTAMRFSDGLFRIGAPQFVLPALPAWLEEAVRVRAEDGARVLLATRDEQPYALVILRDVLRPDAQKTLARFMRDGVQIRLISGDDPRTAAAVAARLGLAGDYADCSALDDAGLAAAAREKTVLGRTTPAQKARIIRALRAEGHTVGMIGDGVNDMAAFREADCSLAMGTGVPAAVQSAQIVLLDGKFAVMPDAVAEGRRVVNNIMRTARLFLVKNIASFVLLLLSLLFYAEFPFIPVQWTCIGIFTVGIPSVFLSLEPNRRRFSGSFVQNVLLESLPGALTLLTGVLIAQYLSPLAGLSALETETLVVWAAAAAGLSLLLRLCLPMKNKMRRRLVILMTLGLVASLLGFADLLSITKPTWPVLLFLLPFAAAAFPLQALYARAVHALSAAALRLADALKNVGAAGPAPIPADGGEPDTKPEPDTDKEPEPEER